MSVTTLSRTTTRSRSNPATPELDLLLEHISPGVALFSTESDGSRGDACTTLLDFALAAATHSVLEPGRSYRPVEVAITPAGGRPRAGRLESEARVVRRAPGIAVVSGWVRDADGQLVATGRLVARA